MASLYPSRMLVDCACGVRFEADSGNEDIVPVVIDHRERCGSHIEWHLLVPGYIDHVETTVRIA